MSNGKMLSFHVKTVQTDKQTDNLSIQGHKKFTKGHTHARPWLSLYKSIENRIIKEIRIHKFNLPKF